MTERTKTRRSAGTGRNPYLMGYAAALGDIIRVNDDPVQIRDVMAGAGLSIEDLRQAGVEELDLDEIGNKLSELPASESFPSGRNGNARAA